MIVRILTAFFVGLSMTTVELVVVARFNRPGEHLKRQTPERKAFVPVVALAAPRPLLSKTDAPPEQPPMEKTRMPAPMLAPSALPGLSVRSSLPERLDDLWVGASKRRSTEPDTAAVARHRPSPIYPSDARQRGIEGFVVVRMRVDAAGRVTDVVVVESDPPGVFDQSARRAAQSYLFSPARAGGIAVATTLEQRMVFRLR